MWTGLVGQEHAIEALERAAQRPGHAYLLVGPPGSGVEVAARSFAAELVAPDGDERIRGLVLRGLHPDVVEFEPGGFSYLVDKDVRERILPEASRAPIEADRKVLVLFEAERLKGNQNESANALLKTLEEPPPRTVVVLVTGAPDDLIPTVRSRCQRVDLEPVALGALEAALVDDGCSADDAHLAARLSGGNLARARNLAGPLRDLRAAFANAPRQVDGTGGTVARVADELDAAVEAAVDTVARRHAEELAEFDADMERHGYSDRDAQRLRRRLEDRQKREVRRARIDLLTEGVTAIESVYRDALGSPASPLNADLAPLAVNARAVGVALDACRAAREAFLINEKGLVRLQYLLLSLPAAGN
ncbi:MAG TPA: AAA family ATPase [Acidimicrobiia bacterium]|jgi:DNA polymerase-3 subunit delta'|nr:AAA family ATPase [Acidimicrobiia bacterium]